MSGIIVRYAATDNDVVLIHRFLCHIAGPRLPGPIDPRDSINEVWRIVNDEVALMAFRGDELVGTMGLALLRHWWGNVRFLGNRWCHALAGSRAWKPLLKEARAIAVASEVECIIASEERGKITILNKSRLRAGPPPLASNLVH